MVPSIGEKDEPEEPTRNLMFRIVAKVHSGQDRDHEVPEEPIFKSERARTGRETNTKKKKKKKDAMVDAS